MSRLLIITGPQGSGNHLFSKCLALHEDVFGWKTLLNRYWEGHHHEPFAEYWEDPSKLDNFDWNQREYFVTSVSSPYFKDQQPVIPNYVEFIEHAQEYVDKIDIGIIGRDQNILRNQQKRVRGKETTPIALQSFNWLFETQNCHFLSQELLQLYRQNYLEQLSREIDRPIAFWNADKDEILKQDSNTKYIKEVHEHWLDYEVQEAVRQS